MRVGPDPSSPRGAALVERRFASVRATGGHAALRERPGRLPVVIAAPHAVHDDAYTGPLALAVGRDAGASVLVADRRRGADPVLPGTPFTRRLAELSAAGKLVVDLHAMAGGAIDVVVAGFGLSADALDEVVDVFEDEDLAVAVDLASMADTHGAARLARVAPALFVAVGDRCRAPLERPDEWEAVVDALVGVVGVLATVRR